MFSMSKTKAILLTLFTLVVIFLVASPSYAWKPKTHIYSANLLLEEIETNNGYVVFPSFGKIKVPDQYLTALRAYPNFFRAGAMGPDSFPDIYVGQVFAHPKTKLAAGDWIKYLLDQMSKLPAGSEERKQVLAFVLGYSVHASGDLFGHSFVNLYAGDSWPEISDADGLSSNDMKVIVRHNAVEEFIDKQIPSKFKTQAYNSISIPQTFIYNNLVSNGKSANYDNVGSDTLDISPFYARTGALPKHFDMFYTTRRELKSGIGQRASYNPVRIYEEFWLEDIDEGMKAWVDTSEKVARDLLLPEEGFTKAKDDLTDWATDHFLSMVGFPEVVGWVIGAIGDISDLIESIIPQFLQDLIDDMKNCFYDVIFQWAFNMKYTHLKAIMEDPSKFLNDTNYFATGTEAKLKSALSNFPSATTSTSQLFHPFENTLKMAKLCLIGQSGMDEIIRLAEMEQLGSSPYPPICFIKSLDVGYDWKDIKFTGLNLWDDYWARDAIFNQIFDPETTNYKWLSKNEREIQDVYYSLLNGDPGPDEMCFYAQMMNDCGWTKADVETDLKQRIANQAYLDDYRKKTEITEELITQDTVISSLSTGLGRAVYKKLNLNGKKLTVNCNLEISRDGMINVNGGTLIVNGDLTIKDKGLIIQGISQGGTLFVNGGTVIVHGNLTFSGGLIDANKGNISVDKDLEQPGGLLNVNTGKITVQGAYALSTIIRHGTTNYRYLTGKGILQMRNDSDKVIVGGPFVTSTKISHENYLTAGVLEVKGDFYQCSWEGCIPGKGVVELFLKDAASAKDPLRDNFKSSGTHRVLLSGTKLQNVALTMTGSSDSQFSILEITNPLEVKFITKVTVSGLFKHNNKKFSLSDTAGSLFPDYDGDGQKDSVDSTPCPADPVNDNVVGTGTTGTLNRPLKGDLTNPKLQAGFTFPKIPRMPGLPDATESDPSARLKDPIYPRPSGTIKDRPGSSGSSGTTPTPSTTPTLKVPANLKAIPGENSVTLQWDDLSSPDILGFKLYRKENADDYTPVINLIIEDTNYVDEGAIAGNTYSYICRAIYKGDKESEPSNSVSTTPFSTEIPGLSASLEGIRVSFELPELPAEGVKGYNIYKGTKPDEQDPKPINRVPITKTEYLDTGTKTGTTYYYVSTMVYEDGSESETSSEISIAVPLPEEPAEPEGIIVTLQIGKSTLKVNGLDMQIDPKKTIKSLDQKGNFTVPVMVFEAFGARITENTKQKSITLVLSKNKITLWQGKTKVSVNGINKTMKIAPQVVNGKVMIPVQFIAENLGCKYTYDSKTKIATITYK